MGWIIRSTSVRGAPRPSAALSRPKVMVQLCPAQPFSVLALLSLPDHAAALACLDAARAQFGERLNAFEGMWPDYLAAVCHDWNIVPAPFADLECAVLLELRGGMPRSLPVSTTGLAR